MGVLNSLFQIRHALAARTRGEPVHVFARTEREFFIDNLLVRIHLIIVLIRWTGLAPREFEFLFSGSLMSTLLAGRNLGLDF